MNSPYRGGLSARLRVCGTIVQTKMSTRFLCIILQDEDLNVRYIGQ